LLALHLFFFASALSRRLLLLKVWIAFEPLAVLSMLLVLVLRRLRRLILLLLLMLLLLLPVLNERGLRLTVLGVRLLLKELLLLLVLLKGRD
jgi:hypothetical protein